MIAAKCVANGLFAPIANKRARMALAFAAALAKSVRTNGTPHRRLLFFTTRANRL